MATTKNPTLVASTTVAFINHALMSPPFQLSLTDGTPVRMLESQASSVRVFTKSNSPYDDAQRLLTSIPEIRSELANLLDQIDAAVRSALP